MDLDKVQEEGFALDQENVSAHRITHEDGRVKMGASDLTCPRQAGFNIMYGPAKRTLEQSYLMTKGNIAEDMFANNLKMVGLKYETQGDYHGPDEMDQIQVHPDFLIDVNDPGHPIGEAKKMIEEAKESGVKHILIEMKTSNAIPTDAHDYWITQVNLQMDYIAIAKGAQPTEVDARVYAIELNHGRHGMFKIEYDPAEVLRAEDGARSFFVVIEEFIQLANGEIEEMTQTVHDIIPTYGTLCNMCDWADMCFKEKDKVELPKDLEIFATELKEWKEKDKNMAEKNTELKTFMQNAGVKKATSENMTLSIRGGNIKDIIDVDAMSDEDKDELWKNNMKVFNLNEVLFSKFEPKRHKEMLKKYKTTKKTAESLILKREK